MTPQDLLRAICQHFKLDARQAAQLDRLVSASRPSSRSGSFLSATSGIGSDPGPGHPASPISFGLSASLAAVSSGSLGSGRSVSPPPGGGAAAASSSPGAALSPLESTRLSSPSTPPRQVMQRDEHGIVIDSVSAWQHMIVEGIEQLFVTQYWSDERNCVRCILAFLQQMIDKSYDPDIEQQIYQCYEALFIELHNRMTVTVTLAPFDSTRWKIRLTKLVSQVLTQYRTPSTVLTHSDLSKSIVIRDLISHKSTIIEQIADSIEIESRVPYCSLLEARIIIGRAIAPTREEMKQARQKRFSWLNRDAEIRAARAYLRQYASEQRVSPKKTHQGVSLIRILVSVFNLIVKSCV